MIEVTVTSVNLILDPNKPGAQPERATIRGVLGPLEITFWRAPEIGRKFIAALLDSEQPTEQVDPAEVITVRSY